MTKKLKSKSALLMSKLPRQEKNDLLTQLIKVKLRWPNLRLNARPVTK